MKVTREIGEVSEALVLSERISYPFQPQKYEDFPEAPVFNVDNQSSCLVTIKTVSYPST